MSSRDSLHLTRTLFRRPRTARCRRLMPTACCVLGLGRPMLRKARTRISFLFGRNQRRFNGLAGRFHLDASATRFSGVMSTPRLPIRALVVIDEAELYQDVVHRLDVEGIVATAAEVDSLERELTDIGVGLLVVDPDVLGADAFVRFLDKNAHVRVFVLASAPVIEAGVQVLSDARVEFLRKPLVPDDMLDALDHLVSHPSPMDVHEKEVLSAVGETLRTMRESRGLTRKDLAQRAGLSSSLLSQLERGETSPSIGSLVRLASALDVPVRSFFEGV